MTETIRYEQVEISTHGGRRTLTDCAARRGDMAVTRGLSGIGWRITHMPTSFALPFVFPSAVAAEACLIALDDVVADWNAFARAFAAAERPPEIPAVVSVCLTHGGERPAEIVTDVIALAHRLARAEDEDE